MKILIVNDTRVENHHGCSRVMNCIDRNLHLRGINDINYIPLAFKWSNYEELKKNILISDLIIINGEGTLHDNAEHVDILLDIIIFGKAYDIPSVIINATVCNLTENNIDKLLHSKLIYVRDKASQSYLLEKKINSSYCPDLTFWNTNDVNSNVERSKIGITEGFNFTPDLKKAKLDYFNEFSVFNFEQALSSVSFWRRLVYKTKVYKFLFNKNIISIENHIKFLSFLNQFKFIITGRYHIVCFCIYLNIPFKYVESNTPKISSLLDDIGLNKEKYKLNNDYQIITFTPEEYEAINTFKKMATNSIDLMFDQILKYK